jgi:hypothetical protein
MFSDGGFLFDAGWLFFAAWSLVLITFFVIAFGEDLLRDPEQQAGIGVNVKKTNGPMQSVASRTR